MDLRISGRRAIVCASSLGLGRACATSLAREGAEVFLNGRDLARVEAAVQFIRVATGAHARFVVADIATATGREQLIQACPEPDILVTNNAGPPPGPISGLTTETWHAALCANLLAQIQLIQAVMPGMRLRKFGRIVNITSAMVKAPRPHQALSATARAGLTAFCKALSLEVAADNVTINNLLPERIDSGRQDQSLARMMKLQGIDLDVARKQVTDTIAAKRFGRPEEVGDACAFLCSDQASFISGQNLQIDGGSYPGLI